jgi:hypothetical protein
MKRILFALSTAALVAFSGATGSAQTIPWLDLSALGGTPTTDSWTQLNAAHYGATGTFPGAGVAVNVGPDTASAFGATFNKTTASENGYLAAGGFYAAFSETHLNVNSAALAGVQTLVFQLNATTGSSGAFVTASDNIDVLVAPTLTLFNSGGGVIASGIAAEFDSINTFASSTAGGFAQNDNLDAYQWDLSAYSSVASYTLSWQVEYHSDINGIKLTQSTEQTSADLTAVATPEPATWAMMIGGLALLVLVTRRQRVLA